MFKVLITNIFIGSLFGVFSAYSIWFVIFESGLDYFIGYNALIVLQSIIGFLLSIPILVIMWKQTKKINNKSILFLGAPTISIFASLSFYSASSKLLPRMAKEAPYILLFFILFYSFIQLIMYYMATKKRVTTKKHVTTKKNLPRSILSIVLGLSISILLPFLTKELIRTFDILPQWSSELTLVYRSVYIVLGSYITARFAPYAFMRHTMILGIIIFLISSFGTWALITTGVSPIWYAYGVAIIVFPSVWFGSLLYQRLHNKYKKYEHITQTKTKNRFDGFKMVFIFLLLIFIWFISNYIIKNSHQYKDILCMSSEKGQGSSKQQKCLEEHIPGYGGYYGIGNCETVVYLTDLKHEEKTRTILLPILKHMNPGCRATMSLDIRKGQYTFSELRRWGGKASFLFLRDEDTRIPNVSGPSGAPYFDNRISWYVKHDDMIPQIKQLLLEHNITLEAFNFRSEESEIKARAKALASFSTAPEIHRSDSTEYVMVPAVKLGGIKAAELIMGKTSLNETLQMLPPFKGHGPKKSKRGKDAKLPIEIQQVLDKLKKGYNPAFTQTIVGFDRNKKLVFVHNMVEREQSERLTDELEAITNMKEMYRDTKSFVRQGELTPCVVVRTSAIVEDSNKTRVNSAAYFFTCETKQ